MKPTVIYPASRLKDLPPIQWAIQDLIPTGSLSMLYGAPGVGKSFVALDWCLTVAAGMPWLSTRSVTPGPALYLPLEAIAGIGQRLRSWERYHGTSTPDDLFYAVDFVTLQHPGPVDDLVGGLEAIGKRPRLVVVDTLSRAMVGAEENSARDANLAMSNLDRLRAKTGCAVLLLHHTNKYTDVERGSTAIRAACDTVLLLKQDGDGLVLTVEKQRDAEPADPTRLYMQPIGESIAVTAVPLAGNHVSADDRVMLQLLESLSIGNDPVPGGVWRASAEEKNISTLAFRRKVKALVEKGYVEKEGTTRPSFKLLKAGGVPKRRIELEARSTEGQDDEIE